MKASLGVELLKGCWWHEKGALSAEVRTQPDWNGMGGNLDKEMKWSIVPVKEGTAGAPSQDSLLPRTL